MKVIHIVEKFFNSGALSSLVQIQNALSKSNTFFDQKIFCLKFENTNKQKKIPDYFPSNAEIMMYNDFLKFIENHGKENCVCIFHKLMCSPTRLISNAVSQADVPSLVVNHTYTDNISYNKLYKFDACVAVSEHMKTKISKTNSQSKIFTIRNIVDFKDVERYNPACRDDNIYLTGRINALNVIKYSSDFINWVLSLSFDKKHIHQYMGGGQYMSSAIGIINSKQNTPSTVQMLGSIGDLDKKFSILKSWDAFLYEINRPEGTSMSVLESLACGVPVICSNHPGNNELIVNGVNGFVFSDYSEAKSILFNYFKSKNNILELKESTINWARSNLTKQKLMHQYEEAIDWVIKNHKFKSSTNSKSKNIEIEKIKNTKDIKKVVDKRVLINSGKPIYNGKKTLLNKKKNNNNKKNSLGIKSLNKNKNTINRIQKNKTYFIAMPKSSFINKDLIYSDYFLVHSDSLNSNNMYKIEETNLSSPIIFDILSLENKIIEFDSDIVLKNTEIIISPSDKMSAIKNLIKQKKLWEEKEK